MSQKLKKKQPTNQPKQPKSPPQIFLQSHTKKQQHNKTWIETAQYSLVYNIKNRERDSFKKKYISPTA